MAIYKDKNKTSDGRCWYFKVYKKDFNGINKAYKSKRYLTKKEAQEEEALFLLKRDNPINKPFNLVANAYFKEMYMTRKESTVDSYKYDYNKHIEPYFKELNINDINISNIVNWKEELFKNEFKVSYLNKLYNTLKSIFDYAIRNYGLTSNPVTIVGRFKEKKDTIIKDEDKLRYITHEQFKEFISVIDDSMWKTFFVVLYYTGMRKSEVLALTWDDIDFEKRIIKVNKTLYTRKNITTSVKNNKNRTITINKSLKEQLLIYNAEIKKFSDYNSNWYVFGCSRFLPPTTIDRYKNKYFKLTNIKAITIHEFRHSHVSLLINEYVKSGQTDTAKFFLMMSDRLGHTIQEMQKTYMHLFDSIQDEIVDLLDNL